MSACKLDCSHRLVWVSYNNNILTNTSSPHPQGKGSDDDIHTMNINGKKVDVMEYIANHKKAEEEFKH